MKKIFRKQDMIFLLIVLIVAVVFFLFYFFYPKQIGSYVQIEMNGENIGSYSLLDNRDISIPNTENPTNIIRISDGKVSMVEADCPDHICVKTGEISKNNETIVCLPNQIVVTVYSENDSEFDSISR